MATKKKDPFRFFKIEAKELLDQLSSGFLELEKHPSDDLLNKLFRFAHTLKGAARLVRLENVGEIAHYIEDYLGQAKSGDNRVSSEDIDRFLKALDTVSVILQRVEDQEDPHIDISDTLSALKSGKAKNTSLSTLDTVQADSPEEHEVSSYQEEPPTVEETQPEKEEQATPISPTLVTPHQPSEDETIRINLKTLNTILNLGGELVINKIKLQEKLNQLKQIKKMINLNTSYTDSWRKLKEILEFNDALTHIPHANDLSFLDKSMSIQQEIRNKINEFSDEYETDIKLTHLISLRLQDEVFKARLLPADTILGDFHRLVRDLSKELGKEVEFQIIGGKVEVDKQILDEMKGALLHLIRNAMDHGIEDPMERSKQGKENIGKIVLQFEQNNNHLNIICEDDGTGIDIEKIRTKAITKKILTEQQAEEAEEKEILYLIMRPGFSTSEIVTNLSGRGVGMDVVASIVSQLRGQITIQSELGKYTRFIIQLPQSLANLSGLLFLCGFEKLLLPLSSVTQTLRIDPEEIETEGNREVIKIRGKATPLVRMNEILKLGEHEYTSTKTPIIVVKSRDDEIAFAVNQLLGVQEVVVKDLGSHIHKVPLVGGSTILGDGHPIIILDPEELVQSVKGNAYDSFKKIGEKIEEADEIRLLVVDDSLTTRMLEKSILESAGYQVDLAISGEDALEKLKQKKYPLIITDVEMPGIDGFELTKTLKNMEEYTDIPMIIVSSLGTSEMKRKGIDAGAQAYIVKGEFDQNILLETIENFL